MSKKHYLNQTIANSCPISKSVKRACAIYKC